MSSNLRIKSTDLKPFNPSRLKKRKNDVSDDSDLETLEINRNFHNPDPFTDEEYKEMLTRIYGLINSSQELEPVALPAVIDIRSNIIGLRKTSFDNFINVCQVLNRDPRHVQEFLKMEFNTTANLSDPTDPHSTKLYIVGRYQKHDLETIIKKYITEYVLCTSCKSKNTVLNKDKGLLFLVCNECHSSVSVPKLKNY